MIELESPQIAPVEELGSYAKYEASPLPAGYGVTLGNALRRVLLSSLEGAAVTAIQIRDVYHEFTSIPGVKEDVTQIVLNVKKLRLKSFATHPVQLKLIKSGAGTRHRRRHPGIGGRRGRQPGTADHDPRLGRRDDRDGPDGREGRRLPRRRAGRVEPDRRHPRRRDLHAGPQGQLLDREHSRRADDQLRQADDRARDGRHDLARGGAQPGRRHPRPPVLALRQHRPRRRRHRTASPRASRSSRRTCSTCRSRSWTCRCGPTTRSSATTSSRSASCSSSPTTICCECATSARSRSTR